MRLGVAEEWQQQEQQAHEWRWQWMVWQRKQMMVVAQAMIAIVVWLAVLVAAVSE